MKLHVLYLTGALIATPLPLSAGAVPVQPDHQQSPALSKPCRLHTLALPVITGNPTVMPSTASFGRRIALCAGE
jgi:hypothetical protein